MNDHIPHYKSIDRNLRTPLDVACEEGNLVLIKKLTFGKSVTNEEGNTLLLACSQGFTVIVEYLLSRHTSVAKENLIDQGLELAIKNDHTEVVYLLFDNKVVFTKEIGEILADFALAHEDLKFLDEVDYQTKIFKDKDFPKLAVRYGSVTTLVHLHNRGVIFNFKDAELFQSFLRQCQFEADSWPVLKHFLKNGADMTAVENSAFMESLERAGNDKAVKYLLDNGYSADF